MKKPDHADVVVVGAGASGVINSLVLAEAGLKVVCLDQGGWTPPSQHPHFSRDFQHQRNNRWSPEPALRRGADDYPVEGDQSHALMWNGVGGSTNIYAALWPRFRPSDFRKGTEHGLAPDWPITYEDLAPFYDAADRMIGVSGLTGDPAVPPAPDYPCGPLPMREKRARHRPWLRPARLALVADAGRRDLGSRDGRAACNGCGNCASGCPRGSMAKMSDHALAEGSGGRRGSARAGARVERIETGADGRASGVVYIDRTTGDRVLQTADIVIIAGNGVGTPRMLLLSENARHPNGLSMPMTWSGATCCTIHWSPRKSGWTRRSTRIWEIPAPWSAASSPRPTCRAVSSTVSTSTSCAPARPGRPQSVPLRSAQPLGRGPSSLVRPPFQP